MHAIESIRMTGETRSTWTVKAPAGQTVTLETEVTEIIETTASPGRSVDGSHIKTQGKVSFRRCSSRSRH
jgi:uncharacterized membrane protein